MCSADDIRKINRIIRKEMEKVTTREELTELKSRIDDTLNSTFPKPGSMREFRFRQGAPPLWRPAA